MPVLLLRRRAAGGEIDPEGTALLAALDGQAGDLGDPEVLRDVVTRLSAHPVMDEAREMARQWSREAVEQLRDLPASPAKEALKDFADLVVERLA